MEQPDAGDPAGMVDLAVVGEREEDVDQVLAEIGIDANALYQCVPV